MKLDSCTILVLVLKFWIILRLIRSEEIKLNPDNKKSNININVNRKLENKGFHR